MNARTSPSSRRRSSRRKRSSVRASSGSGLDDPLDVLDLEDRVRERLGRPVVDLLGEPRALGLLGLDDPHLGVVRGRRGAPTSASSGRVAALEEEPASARGSARASSSLAELGLVVAEVASIRVVDVAAEGPSAGVVGAGLGRVGGRDRRGRRRGRVGRGRLGAASVLGARARRGAPASARAISAYGLAVALAHAAQRVRAVADRRLRLRVESVEAAVPSIGPGACWLHRTSEYTGRLSWADDLERADVRPSGSGRRPAGPPRSSSRKQSAPSTPVVEAAGQLAVLAARRGRRGACPGTPGRGPGRGRRAAARRAGPASRDPLRLGHPDREVGDDRAGGRVERVADRGHPAAELRVLRRPSSRDPAPNDGSSATENSSRAEDAEQRPEPGDRPGPAQPARRAGRSARRGRAAPTRRAGPGPGPAAWRNVPHVVATGKTRLVTRNVDDADEDERPDRGAARLPRQRRGGR